MEQILTQFTNSLGGSLSSVLGAAVFFIVGWIIALIAGSLIRRLMASMNVNGRFNNGKTGSGTDFERIASRLVFWFVLLFAITGALNMLNLDSVSAPLANLLNKVTSFIPSIIGAAILALVGWALATLVRSGITSLLGATSLDEELSAKADVPPLSNSIGNIFYWLVILFFIPMILQSLGMVGLLEPVKNMIDKIINFLPNLLIAGVIGFVGYIVARILRGIVTNVISTLNLQSLLDKAGLKATNLANIAGMVVFLLVMVPTIISALDALKIEAISRPATNMLDQIMAAVPNIMAAGMILVVAFFVSRFIANIVTSLLDNTGINEIPAKMGLGEVFNQTKASGVVGKLIIIYAMILATSEAANRLGFVTLKAKLADFINFGSNVLFGAIILMIGFWLANVVANIVKRSESGSDFLAMLVRVVITGLVLAMGLKAMGIADSIVNLAFGLTLGGAAVAFALAFGLGGQEAAGRVLKNTLDRLENDKKG